MRKKDKKKDIQGGFMKDERAPTSVEIVSPNLREEIFMKILEYSAENC